MISIGYQETWIVPNNPQDFSKLLDAYHKCVDNGFYDDASNHAVEPLSVVVLKKQLGEIPANTMVLWAGGVGSRHDAKGLFGGNLPEGMKIKVIPIEELLNPDSPEVQGIDFAAEKPSENEFMKRWDISQVKNINEIEPKNAAPKEKANNVTPFHKEKKLKKQPEPVKPEAVSTESPKLEADPANEKQKDESAAPEPEPASVPEQRFDAAQIWLIEQGMQNGVDVTVYADPKYDWQQMHVIKRGLEQGLDVAVFANPEYTHGQMSMLLRGLQQNFDISVYTDPHFSTEQMQEIVSGMESGVNVSRYADTKYTWLQMMEIRKGLEGGLDVSAYANPTFTDAQMRTFRNALEVQINQTLDRAFVRFPLLERALEKAKERFSTNQHSRSPKKKKRARER